MAVITLLTSALEQFNSFTRQYASFSSLSDHNILQALCSLSNRITALFHTPQLLLFTLLTVLLLIAAIAVVMGLLYAGFFHQLSQSVQDKGRKNGEYRTGISRYFVKLSCYFFCVIVFSVLFVAALLYATVPSVLSIRLFFAGSSNVFIPMLGLCTLTLVVIIFAILFYAMYMTFAIPSMICFRKGGINVAFRMVNGYCWYLMPRTILFLVVNLLLRAGLMAIHYGLNATSASICILIATWGIRTICYFLYLHFVFTTFSAMRSDMFGEDA